MRPILAFAAAAIALPAAAAGHHAAGPEVAQPWSRPAAAGTNGVGYMTVLNRGGRPDALVAVASPAAAKVEMHSSSMAGGVMSMARVERVPLAPGGEARFAPGAYHLMFIKLARPLRPGDRLPATLTFASGAKLKVEFQVGSGFGPPPSPR